MKSTFTITVKEPCKEKFSNFSTTEKGGFCQSCEKEVIDFTKFSDKELVQFGEYKTKAFYDWHSDTSWNPAVPFRKLSVTVNLSNPKDYAGGNFEMKNVQGQELKMPIGQIRKQGTVIVFPSFLKHRVTEVTRGTRYSLVQWLNGPDFV